MAEAVNPILPEIPYQAIIEQSLAGIYVLQDECFCYANATFAGMLGYTSEEMVGCHLGAIVRPGFLSTVLDRYHRRLAGNPPSMRFVTEGVHRDGRIILIEVHGTRTLYRDRPAVVGIGIEATQRLQNEEALRRSRLQLQALSAHTVRKLEEQRLQFARDLHDEIGGMLTAIKMDTNRVLRRVADPQTQGITQELLDLTQRAIDTVKQLSEELRPSALDHLDLSVAIARDLEDFSRRSGLTHALCCDAAPGSGLSPKRANAVYRVFQEALTNVARHARASKVQVALTLEGAQFVLEMVDDGCGFDIEDPQHAGLGLLGMSERAREIGGTLHIQSALGEGSRLTMRAPLMPGYPP